MDASPSSEPTAIEERSWWNLDQLEVLVEALPQLVLGWNSQGQFLFCNRRWYNYTGQTPSQAQGRGWMLALHPEDRPGLANHLDQAAQSGEGFQAEYRVWNASQVCYRRHQGRAVPRKCRDGQVVDWIAYSSDIDEQAGVEEHIRQLVTVVENSPDFVGVATLGQEILSLNRTGQAMVGVDGNWVVQGTKLEDYVFAEDLPFLHQTVWPTLLQGGEWVGELRLRHLRTSEPIAGFWNLFLVRNPRTGEPTHVGIHTHDIRPQKAAEVALRASEAQYRRLYDSMRDAFASVDLDGSIRECNEAFCRMLGYDAGELRRLSYQDITPEKWWNAEAVLLETQVLVRGYSEIFEKEYRRKDGTVFPVELRTFLVRDDAGQPCGMSAIVRDITERKQAEDALRESERRLRALIETAPYGAYEYELRPDGRLVFVGFNQAADRITGVNHEQFLGKTIEEAFPPLAATPIPAAYREVAETGKRYEDQHLEYTHAEIAGVYEYSAFQTAPHRMAVLFRDITERRRAEEALQESDTRLRMALSAAQMGTWRWAVACNQDTRDATMNRMLGLEAVEATYGIEDFYTRVHPEDLAKVKANFERACRGGKVYAAEFRVCCPDGTIRWLRAQGRPCYDEAGELTYVAGVVMDITERKRSEELVLESQRRLSTLLSNLPGMAYRCRNDVQWTMEFISDGCVALTGYTPEDLVENRRVAYGEIIHPEDRQAVWDNVEKAIAERRHFQLEYRIITASGEERWIWEQGIAICSDTGQAVALEGLMMDFTEHKRAEEALRRQAAFDTLINQILARFASGPGPELDAHLTATLREIGTSMGADDTFVLQVKHGTPSWQITHYWHVSGTTVCSPAEQTFLREALAGREEQLVQGEVFQIDITNRRPPGESLSGRTPDGLAALLAVPLRGQGGRGNGCLGLRTSEEARTWLQEDLHRLQIVADVIANVLERQRVEEELHQYREQLEELVQRRTLELVAARDQAQDARAQAEAASRAKSIFLASMSHELRTPLNAVLGFSYLLRGDPALNASQRESLDIINRSGAHLLGLINDVLDISKIEAGGVGLKEVEFDLNRALETIQEMMLMRAKAKGLCFRLDCDPTLPRHIRADEKKLKQIIVNLAGNAVKFTAAGEVTLRVRGAEGGRMLRFEVEDSGPGIEPDMMPRLFEPFVQGGPHAEGAGLGLFISRRLVELMGGYITVESEPGKGSRFSFAIRLETVEHPAHTSVGTRRRVTGLAPGQLPRRVLVAEDRPESRLFMVQTLEAAGFEVIQAQNGEEAVQLFEQRPPHLVLMDMRMPVMDGYEAIRRIKAMTAGKTTPIVAVSASALEDDRQEILAAGADGFLSKPMQPQALFEKLQALLGVEYVYAPEEVEGRAMLDQATLGQQLTELSAELANQLAQTMDVLDLDAFKALLPEVARQSPALAEALRRLVEACEVAKLTELLALRNRAQRDVPEPSGQVRNDVGDHEER